MSRLFISHASADVNLIEPFVELLQTGLNIREEYIFCSSLEGMGIPRGSKFVDFIHKSLQESDFVLTVITPAYFESHFCMCELGATWITCRDGIPLLVPPLEYDDLKAVLNGTQSGFINEVRTLNELRDRLIDIKIASGATQRWESKRDTFITRFKQLQKSIQGRTVVAASEVAKLKNQYEQLQETVVEHLARIDELKQLVDRLKECKDPNDVSRALLEDSDHPEKFDAIIEKIVPIARSVGEFALKSLFHLHRGTPYKPETDNSSMEGFQVNLAAERGLIKIKNECVSPDLTHPKMKELNRVMNELQEFMQGTDTAFIQSKELQDGFQFSLENRDFWRNYFYLK
jgi:hypothetical protein